jgi:hypothetical protein
MISKRKFHGLVGNQIPAMKLIASHVTDSNISGIVE